MEGCGRPHAAKGYCSKHYNRLLRYGDALREPADFRGRLLANIEQRGPGECWPWTGPVSPGGYGRIGTDKSGKLAHRSAYEFFVGPIPNGLTVDHLCHRHEECEGGVSDPHRRCCNPTHLGLAPIVDNSMRGNSPWAKNARKTHCVHDHPYDEANTAYDRNGDRYCRECSRIKSRDYQRRKRAAQAA